MVQTVAQARVQRADTLPGHRGLFKSREAELASGQTSVLCQEAALFHCCEGASPPASGSPAVTWGWGKGGSLTARLGLEEEKGGGDGEAGPACAWEARAPHKKEWNANARLICSTIVHYICYFALLL